jgi:two-component system, NarL family, invasion response regulator UvrY
MNNKQLNKMEYQQKHNVVLVDDHDMMRIGISQIMSKFDNYEVIWEATNGQDFINKLKINTKPEIVILDISMPVMDGYATARYLKDNFPKIKILVFTVYLDEDIIIKMVKAGIHGYIVKDANPEAFKKALDEVMEDGYSYSGFISKTLAKNVESGDKSKKSLKISARERQFLELVCGDMTYKEIADKLHVSKRSVDKYRDSLLSKLGVKTKASLVLYSVLNGYYKAGSQLIFPKS